MSKIVAVKLPHVSPKHVRPGSMVHPTCAVELYVSVGQDTGEEDTSGPYYYTEDYGRRCAECDHIWTPSEREKIDSMAIEAASLDEDDDDLDMNDMNDDFDDDNDLDDDEDEDLDDFIDNDGGEDDDEDYDPSKEDL